MNKQHHNTGINWARLQNMSTFGSARSLGEYTSASSGRPGLHASTCRHVGTRGGVLRRDDKEPPCRAQKWGATWLGDQTRVVSLQDRDHV
jgi:hypothetical protein